MRPICCPCLVRCCGIAECDFLICSSRLPALPADKRPKKRPQRLTKWTPGFDIESATLPPPAELPPPPEQTESHTRSNPSGDRSLINYTGEPLRLPPGVAPPPFNPRTAFAHLLRLPLAKVKRAWI